MAKVRFNAEPGKNEIVITSTFAAPPETVFKAITDPVLIPRWWGPRRLTTTVDTMEVRPGGHWRFVQKDAEGNTYAFHGEYREIIPSKKLVYTFEYEGMAGHEMIETVTFEGLESKTRVVDTVRFPDVNDRDGALQTGMESGAVESMERFAELVKKTKPAK